MNTSEGELSLSEIGQVSINVHDLDRATDFYHDVLGMHHLFSARPKMAFFACGGVRLMLAVFRTTVTSAFTAHRLSSCSPAPAGRERILPGRSSGHLGIQQYGRG